MNWADDSEGEAEDGNFSSPAPTLMLGQTKTNTISRPLNDIELMLTSKKEKEVNKCEGREGMVKRRALAKNTTEVLFQDSSEEAEVEAVNPTPCTDSDSEESSWKPTTNFSTFFSSSVSVVTPSPFSLGKKAASITTDSSDDTEEETGKAELSSPDLASSISPSFPIAPVSAVTAISVPAIHSENTIGILSSDQKNTKLNLGFDEADDEFVEGNQTALNLDSIFEGKAQALPQTNASNIFHTSPSSQFKFDQSFESRYSTEEEAEAEVELEANTEPEPEAEGEGEAEEEEETQMEIATEPEVETEQETEVKEEEVGSEIETDMETKTEMEPEALAEKTEVEAEVEAKAEAEAEEVGAKVEAEAEMKEKEEIEVMEEVKKKEEKEDECNGTKPNPEDPLSPLILNGNVLISPEGLEAIEDKSESFTLNKESETSKVLLETSSISAPLPSDHTTSTTIDSLFDSPVDKKERIDSIFNPTTSFMTQNKVYNFEVNESEEEDDDDQPFTPFTKRRDVKEEIREPENKHEEVFSLTTTTVEDTTTDLDEFFSLPTPMGTQATTNDSLPLTLTNNDNFNDSSNRDNVVIASPQGDRIDSVTEFSWTSQLQEYIPKTGIII